MTNSSSEGLPILGFGLSGYRSFGPEMQYFGPLSKVTLLAGPNNSGKSNVLSFLVRHYSRAVQELGPRKVYALTGLDVSQANPSVPLRFAIPIPNTPNYILELSQRLTSPDRAASMLQILTQLLHSKHFSPRDGVSWIPIDTSVQVEGSVSFPRELIDRLRQTDAAGNTSYGMTRNAWHLLWGMITGQTGGDLAAHWIPQGLSVLVQKHIQNPSVVYVPAFRRVNLPDASGSVESGHGLIELLAKLQNPTPADYAVDKPKFDSLTAFVREVLLDSRALIEVQHDRATILVHLGQRRMPLANLGTGIEQVVLLAGAATLHERKLICLEEPEMNLHPVLQKHLMKYLSESTSNQYLISTHSAHLLDTHHATVYRIESVDGWTRATRVLGPDSHIDVCSDLGYRPSDLLQANAVIWVEGPSDRIYILNWISSLASELVEGLHFSIMFYGGSLLKHLSAEDSLASSEIRDWIELRKINQHFAVIMDSDRKVVNSPIGEAKKRVLDELKDSAHSMAWLTDARTIESYVPPQILSAAIRTVHPKAEPKWTGNKFGAPLGGVNDPDKTAIARKVTEGQVLPIDMHDLRKSMERIVDMIRKANPPMATA